MAVIKIIRKTGFTEDKIVADKEIRKTPMRFMWIPGVKPVKVPARIPRRIVNKNSIIIVAKEKIIFITF